MIKRIYILFFALTFVIASHVRAGNCPIIDMSVTHVSCFNGSDGKIVATITSGTGDYYYDWSDGTDGNLFSDGSVEINNKPSGVYTIYVVDLNTGCSSTSGIT